MERETERNNNLYEEIMLQIGAWLNTPKIKMVNIPRMKFFYAAAEKLISSIDTDWLESEITVTECPLETGDITLSFDVSNFVVRDAAAFSESVSHFSNFEIYPTDDEGMHFAAIFPQAMHVCQITE